jgi:hypothetical protein
MVWSHRDEFLPGKAIKLLVRAPMMQRQLTLEVLNGPLDGAEIVIATETEWSRGGDGPLAFPWDAELGEPQAKFTVDDQGWWIEGLSSPHGTYRLSGASQERITAKRALAADDVFKASATWLRVIRWE